MDLIKTKFYKKYIGDYAKRFYTPFEKQNLMKIIGFKRRNRRMRDIGDYDIDELSKDLTTI